MKDQWTDKLEQSSLRPDAKKRLRAGRQAFLDEVKPSQAQVEHGLGLHYDSFVADAQGMIPTRFTGGLLGDTLLAGKQVKQTELNREDIADREAAVQLGRFVTSCKTLESAFDPQWQQWRDELLRLTGIRLGSEDVAHPDENRFDAALRHLAQSRLAYDCSDTVRAITHIGDLDRITRSDGVGTFLHLAAVGCFAEADEPLRELDLFYALGVRMMQLTYIQENKLASSWLQGDADRGLTDLGKRVVQRMNELGVMVDLAHCGPQSALDTVNVSSEPVLISHTACCGVYDDREDTDYVDLVFAQSYTNGVPRPATPPAARNASDELLHAVAKHDGVAAFYNIGYMLMPGRDVGCPFGVFADHLEHAIGVAGPENVAIGADRTFVPGWPPAACDWTNWPYYTVGLVCRGLTDDAIRNVIGGNFLRYAKRILDKQPSGEFMAS